jgi:50S ribosomal protein L16 3-hydroxylase
MTEGLPEFRLPLSPQDFLDRYWQRQPLVMRSAATGLTHPEPDLLAGLALEDGVESRLIRGAEDKGWSLKSAPLAEDDLTTLPERDWTLLVQSVDCYLTEVSLLLDCFDFLPAWRLDDIMISAAADGGGVGPHFDRYDVFLVQARGLRRWRLGPGCGPDTPQRDAGGLRLLEDMPVEEEFVLEPGDVLYLPPGQAHWGLAQGSDCVTWSVGFRAPTAADVLDRLTDAALGEVPEQVWGDPGRAPASAPGELEPGDRDALARHGAALLDDPDRRARALCALLSEPRQESLDFALDIRHILARAPDTALVRHGGARLLYHEDSVGPSLWINGHRHRLGAEETPLARLLARKRRLSRDELDSVLTSRGDALLEEWIDDGYFARA